jgi:hypothetical protein
VLIEAERAGVDQEGGPDQIKACRTSCRLTIMIELGGGARQIGGGAAETEGVADGKGQISVPNQAPAGASGKFGERCPDPSHSRCASEEVESLTQVVTALILGGGLQCDKLSDAVSVAEQGLVIQAPGPAAG